MYCIPGITALWQVNNDDQDRAERGAHVEAGGQLKLPPVGEGGGKVDRAHPLTLHYLVQAAHTAAPTHTHTHTDKALVLLIITYEIR